MAEALVHAHGGNLVVHIPRWDPSALEVVCGIANAGGGILLLPATRRDYSAGFRRMRRSFETIPDAVLSELGIQCTIAPIMDGADFFLEIDVPAASEPIALHGSYWLYADGRNTRQTYESIFRSWQDDASSPWELKALPYVEHGDISNDALLAIASIPIGSIDDSGSLIDTIKNRVDHLGLTHPRTKKLVNAGALMLCANPARFIPGATVNIASFAADGSPTGNEDEVIGPLPQQIDEAVHLVMEKYLPAISTAKAFVRNSPPEAAIREAITNAVLHKNYSSGVPVRITVSPHRLVVQNVGGMPEGWTEEDLVEPHAPRFRNPVLATAARLLDITPGWGEGMEKMRACCSQAGAELPHFEISPERTAVSFALPATKRGASAVRAAAQKPAGDGAVGSAQDAPGRNTQRTTFAERSIAAAHKLDLTQTDEYVLQVLTTNGRATAQRIAQVLGVSERTVRRSFKKLREYGFIERIGSDKAGYWSVNE